MTSQRQVKQRCRLPLTCCCVVATLQATTRGGAICSLIEARVQITDSRFMLNAALSGGAVHASTGTNATLSLVNIVFADNRAASSSAGGVADSAPKDSTASGGAVAALGPMAVDMTNVQATNHSAQDHGGMLFCSGCYSLSLIDSSISGSSAGGAGGAVVALNLNGTSLVQRTSFVRNTAGGKAR